MESRCVRGVAVDRPLSSDSCHVAFWPIAVDLKAR